MYLYLKKVIISLVATCTMCIGCNYDLNHNKKEQLKIIKYSLEYSIPNIKDDGSLFILNNKIEVYKNDNYSLYRLPYVFTLEKDSLLVKQEIRYSVFVFGNINKTGLFYKDEFNQDSAKTVLVDSVLKESAFSTMEFYMPEMVNLVKVDADSENILQTFAVKKKDNEFQFDSMYVYYNKQAVGINYSFSTILDTNRLFKLYKFKLICSAFFSKKYNLSIPKRDFVFELYKYKLISQKEKEYFYSFVKKIN